MQTVPVVDMIEAENNLELLQPIDQACRDHGFFFLKNHGMDKEIDAMWQASEAFFNLPTVDKRQIMRTEERHLGYYDRELTKRKRDLKEVFDYMLPRDSKSVDLNQWPVAFPEFKQVMLDFFSAATLVADRTLILIYKALAGANADIKNLPVGDGRTSNVRLNCYPVNDPLSDDEKLNMTSLGDMALHHHTDPGILTLLLQDMTGGLQAVSGDHGWIDVIPEPGTIVVNLGDAMQVWTNDIYRSAIHRVRTMQRNSRYSTP
jgi:isopenicillin N synthase-like dioxygenase